MVILLALVEVSMLGGYAASRSQRVRLAVAHLVHDEAQARWREFKRKHPAAARRLRAMRRGWRREPVGAGTRRPPGRPPRSPAQPRPPRRGKPATTKARALKRSKRVTGPPKPRPIPRPDDVEPDLIGPSPEEILGPLELTARNQPVLEGRRSPMPDVPASPGPSTGMSGADAVNIESARAALDDLAGVGLSAVDSTSAAKAGAEGALTNVDALAGQLAACNLDSETLGEVAGITEAASAFKAAIDAAFSAAEMVANAANAARAGLDARHSVMEEAVAATPEPADIDFYRH